MIEDDLIRVFGNVLENDSDPDSTEISMTKMDGTVIVEPESIPGKYGTLHIKPDGSYVYELDSDLLAVQQLGRNETAMPREVFFYEVTDGKDTSQSSLEVTVQGSNDLPVVDSKFITAAEQAINVPLDLKAPIEIDATDRLQIFVTGTPRLGVVTHTDGRPIFIGDTLTISELTSLLYQAPPLYDGSEAGNFAYSVVDVPSPYTGQGNGNPIPGVCEIGLVKSSQSMDPNVNFSRRGQVEPLAMEATPFFVASQTTNEQLMIYSLSDADLETSGGMGSQSERSIEVSWVRPRVEDIGKVDIQTPLVKRWSGKELADLDLPDELRELPNDRYRVYLVREDGSKQLLLDVIVRDQTLLDPAEMKGEDLSEEENAPGAFDEGVESIKDLPGHEEVSGNQSDRESEETDHQSESEVYSQVSIGTASLLAGVILRRESRAHRRLEEASDPTMWASWPWIIRDRKQLTE